MIQKVKALTKSTKYNFNDGYFRLVKLYYKFLNYLYFFSFMSVTHNFHIYF